jgi:hypothetical protein
VSALGAGTYKLVKTLAVLASWWLRRKATQQLVSILANSFVIVRRVWSAGSNQPRRGVARPLAPAGLLIEADAERGLADYFVREKGVGGMNPAETGIAQ